MPQLNPIPWFYTFLFTWFIILSLLKLMASLYSPVSPSKQHLLHQLNSWTWMWL